MTESRSLAARTFRFFPLRASLPTFGFFVGSVFIVARMIFARRRWFLAAWGRTGTSRRLWPFSGVVDRSCRTHNGFDARVVLGMKKFAVEQTKHIQNRKRESSKDWILYPMVDRIRVVGTLCQWQGFFRPFIRNLQRIFVWKNGNVTKTHLSSCWRGTYTEYIYKTRHTKRMYSCYAKIQSEKELQFSLKEFSKSVIDAGEFPRSSRNREEPHYETIKISLRLLT